MVLGWIQAQVIGSYEEHVNSVIQKQLDEITSPVAELNNENLPWNN
jgi:hypothetical protein